MNRRVVLATWVLEHFVPRAYSEAVAGDLLEELHAGRSIAWYWRQVFSAVVIGLAARSRDLALPLAFSLAWSLLYPAWQLSVWQNRLTRSLFDRWSTLDWPFSALLMLAHGLLPAATLVWLGFLLYLALRARASGRQSALRVVGGLSLSLSVLLVATLALFTVLSTPQAEPSPHETTSPLLAQEFFAQSPHHLPLSLALAASLLSAILSAPPTPGRRRPPSTAFRA